MLSSRVLFHTPELDRVRAFYEHTLGLHIYRQYGLEGETLGVVYFLGGGFLEVSRSSPPSSPLTLWLQVADVRQEEDRLRSAGVEVVKPMEWMPWGLIESWILDSEGNELRLIEVPDDHPLRSRL